MYFNTHVTIEADHHRQVLLDEAASYRLARLARADRRKHGPEARAGRSSARLVGSGAAESPTPPPDHAQRDPQPSRPATDRGARNSDADCRYPVPR